MPGKLESANADTQSHPRVKGLGALGFRDLGFRDLGFKDLGLRV